MTITYQTTVTGVGELAAEFAAEGILVFFGSDAPEELHEFAILTDHSAAPTRPVEAGDELEIGGNRFPVLCVGAVANDNISNLGHLVVKFNGLTEPELPGDVSLPAVEAPTIEPGAVIRIIAKGD
jgi:PTS system glucitol/sorbitol-specific IIA component